jgi:hypothetical protein
MISFTRHSPLATRHSLEQVSHASGPSNPTTHLRSSSSWRYRTHPCEVRRYQRWSSTHLMPLQLLGLPAAAAAQCCMLHASRRAAWPGRCTPQLCTPSTYLPGRAATLATDGVGAWHAATSVPVPAGRRQAVPVVPAQGRWRRRVPDAAELPAGGGRPGAAAEVCRRLVRGGALAQPAGRQHSRGRSCGSCTAAPSAVRGL